MSDQLTKRRLRTPAAAEYLGIAESTLEKWRVAGTGPEFERAGTRIVVYSIESLEAFLVAPRPQHERATERRLRDARAKRPRCAGGRYRGRCRTV